MPIFIMTPRSSALTCLADKLADNLSTSEGCSTRRQEVQRAGAGDD